MNGLELDFEKQELEEFIEDYYKAINISANISMQINDKDAGTLFVIENS